MISIVMPYWQRRILLERGLARYAELYGYSDLEIVIVDDGSPEPLGVGEYPWPITVSHLPRKDHALNPCVPLNHAAALASGEILVLTNPEIVHRRPILDEMRRALEELGPKGHVSAACWSVELEKWYCKTGWGVERLKLGRERMPPGAGFHFCSMMYRDFFNEVGGFSEEYRDGRGYEDNDFLWKLHFAGARFKILDHCVVDHYRAPVKWPPSEVNHKIFLEKWESAILS